MKKLIALIVLSFSFFEINAQCVNPSSDSTYFIKVPIRDDKQLQSKKFQFELKELLIQQIYTSINVIEDSYLVSENGKSKETFNSNTNSFSSGILINPQTDLCGKKVIFSVEKKYVHDLAHNILTKVIQTDIETLKVLEGENRNSKFVILKAKLERLKKKEAYYESIEPLALLSDKDFDISKYKEFKRLLSKMDIKVKSFQELSSEISDHIMRGSYGESDNKLKDLEILIETKKQRRIYNTLLKRNKKKKSLSYKNDKKILRENVKQYFMFYEGQASSMFEVNPTQDTGYNINALSSHSIGLQFNDNSNSVGFRTFYKYNLNSYALLANGRLPFISRTNTSELGVGLHLKISSPSVRLGFVFDFGYMLNKFVGKYDYGLSDDNLTNFSQYTNMSGKNIITYSSRIILNYSSRNFVPTFYIGSTYYSSKEKANFVSINIGTNIKIRISKIGKDDMESLKNRYDIND